MTFFYTRTTGRSFARLMNGMVLPERMLRGIFQLFVYDRGLFFQTMARMGASHADVEDFFRQRRRNLVLPRHERP